MILRPFTQSVIARLTAETCKLSLVDGTAFFWPDTDISAYVGTEGSDTPYKVNIWDNAGKVAIGYLGAVGGGEALDSELITNWVNNGTYPYDTFTPNVNGHDLDSVILSASPPAFCSNSITPTVGKLNKVDLNVTINSGENLYVFTGNASGSGENGSLSYMSYSGAYTKYYTATSNDQFLNVRNNNIADSSVLISHKEVTDCPATALKIVSAKNGSTHNWFHIDTGFNYNAANYNVQIMRAR